MIDVLNFGGLSRRFLALTFCVAAMGSPAAFAQGLAGTYVLLGDSDGTKPRAGAKLELTFSGTTAGAVKLFATRPGETVHDTGTYSIANKQITIHFKEVDWAADRKPYAFDGCTLTLPFMAVSTATGPGTSAWQREDAKCNTQQAAAAPSPPKGAAQGQPRSAAKGSPGKPFTPFSADEIFAEAGQRQTTKIYATEKALREESQENGQASIRIVRLDRGVMWIIDPQRKTYTETRISLGGSTLRSGAVPPGCNVVGEEQVGGFRCQKQVCHVTLPGKDYTETRWAPTELVGVVVRATDGTRTMELENLKIGTQDPALFEVPSGYQKSDQ